MNKFSKLLTGAFAIALCACSSEEPIVDGGGNQIPAGPTGDTAYLAIDLCDANSMGRGTDGGFEFDESRGDENYVKNAYFYFYDESGRFVSEGNFWTGGTPNGVNGNVEFFGDNTVILSGLAGKTFPTYVVTVLNKPSKNADGTDFAPGATLDEMGKIILASYKEGNSFIMTTTSWRGDADDHEDDYYFATKLHSDNFFDELPNKDDITDDRRAEIYVERLAVKVRVNTNLGQPVEKNGKKLYKLNMTAAGSENDGENDGNAADTDLWISFEGWGLNSVAKTTNLMKNLEGLTNSTAVDNWNSWNQPGLHRSYWGKATTYGLAGDALTSALKTITYPELTNKLGVKIGDTTTSGDADYCCENTNDYKNISNEDNTLVIPAKTTSVLLKAIVCDSEGNPLDIVTYQGLTFLKDRFIAYVMQVVNPQYFTRKLHEGGDANKDSDYDYTPITVDDVTLAAAGHGTGSVNVALTEDAAKKTWYTVTMGTEGVASATEAEAGDINERLASATPKTNKAIAATTGATYYPIAIEHLNNPKSTDARVINAQYGVVRNHVYELNINAVKALGNGVFKPSGIDAEPLVPEDPKDPKYYVGARINILSWKIVNQDVTLD